MLPTPPQADAAAGEVEEFHNWAGKGAADLILPKIKENPLVAKVKTLEAKVTDSESRIAELDQKVTDSDSRIAELEQKVADSERKFAELEQKVSVLLHSQENRMPIDEGSARRSVKKSCTLL